MSATLVYGVKESREKISEIQKSVSKGLIPEILNNATNEELYMLNKKMLDALMSRITIINIVEFDEELKRFTVHNEIIPHFYGEGASEEEAKSNMFEGVLAFLDDYQDSIDLYAGIFDGIQQFIIANLLLKREDINTIKEILNIA